MHALDYPTFFVPDARGFATIITMYSKATSEPFPVEAIMRKWNNVRGQVSFLRHAVQAPPELFSFASLPHRAVDIGPAAKVCDLSICLELSNHFYLCINVSMSIFVSALVVLVVVHTLQGAASNWVSLDLIELLLTLSTTEHYPEIRAIFDIPIKQNPDLLIVGIAQLKANWNAMALELCSVLMPMYITGYPTSNAILHRLWQLNPSIVIRALVYMHGTDPGTLSRLLDIAQELKVWKYRIICSVLLYLYLYLYVYIRFFMCLSTYLFICLFMYLLLPLRLLLLKGIT